MTTRTKDEIRAEIDNLMKIEVHVDTNQGTYGATEAVRKGGCGDPRFADREVYETVGGDKRETGPDADHASGRMRPIGSKTLSDYRKQVAALRAEMRKAK